MVCVEILISDITENDRQNKSGCGTPQPQNIIVRESTFFWSCYLLFHYQCFVTAEYRR